MKIALASPTFSGSVNECLSQLEILVKEAAQQHAEIICFPETYIPGYPAKEFKTGKSTKENMQYALQKACAIAKENTMVIILPMDWFVDEAMMNVAFVIDKIQEV